MNRRSFFATLVNPPPASAAMTVRTGVHGEKVGLLGYGAMRYPTVDGGHANSFSGGSTAPIDVAAVQKHIDYCIEHGVNYFDTSPAYCRGESEKVLGDALAKHPRGKWLVATKLSNFAAQTQTAEASRKMYETSRRLLRTDVIDFYLLHAIGGGGKNAMKVFNARFIDNGMLDFLLAERAAGRIRNLGFSFHGSEEVFRHALAMHARVHWDFVQIQMNYIDWKHAKEVNARNVNAETLYGLLAEKGIPVVVMEPLLGGRLARTNLAVQRKLTPLDPAASPARWAFRFAGSFPKVLTVLSGMTYIEHLKENVAIYSPLKPLDAAELSALERAAKAFLADDSVPCTACAYCMPCPYGLDIPAIFALWNAAQAEGWIPDDPGDSAYAANRRRFLVAYERALPPLRRAERCTGCGRCVPHCPQSIEISGWIRKIDAFVEKLRRNGRA
ncbi:MAG: aldo/keto reductase [Kiritimatiellia bacterium]